VNTFGSNRWEKLGLLFQPGGADWMRTHAQNPLPESLGDGYFRVYFASRDAKNQARGGFFVFHIDRTHEIVDISPSPVLGLGSLGAFDDAGVMPSSIVGYEGKKQLYYTGWSRTVDVPFAFHIGLAASRDGKLFERVSEAPVLGRNDFDPYITGAPCVIQEGRALRMWYVSGTKWVVEKEGERPKHYYTIKHAESEDGLAWKCSDHLCLGYREDEYAIARPVVWKEGGKYLMWFTFRGGTDTYRVCTAESTDGINWHRASKNLGIDVSAEGWDSEMICYAHPIFYGGRTYALYNGNGYGATGIGLAVLE